MKEHLIIAIDGPAGSGKSTVAKMIAEKLKLLYIDTGAMYRTITYAALLYSLDVNDENCIKQLLKKINLIIQKSQKNEIEIILDNRMLQKEIRMKEVEKYVSLISSYRSVREYCVDLQRNLSRDYDVILDGRDIGTVVFPNASYKFYLDASVEERAKRRLHDAKTEQTLTREEIKKEIIRRDEFDKNRKISPLKQADDALYIDTTKMSISDVVKRIITQISK